LFLHTAHQRDGLFLLPGDEGRERIGRENQIKIYDTKPDKKQKQIIVKEKISDEEDSL